jgi:molybdopterin/thiamine biosynthesis adenylyltransferase
VLASVARSHSFARDLCAVCSLSDCQGRIGIIDFDAVDVSNLQRQIIHSEATVGMNKAESARRAVNSLNSMVRVETFEEALSSSNALRIAREFDVLVDATDNAATRYLLNDTAVLLGKPLVSGSALRMEGQLTVYNYRGGPCYRCLFPKPPPADSVANCSDSGVLGAVPGVIGCLEALETVKVIAETGSTRFVRACLCAYSISCALWNADAVRRDDVQLPQYQTEAQTAHVRCLRR